MEDDQPESRNNLPFVGRARTRISSEKRYRIELGVGSAAKEALERWRLFVDTWNCTSPAELLQRAMDSLLVQTSRDQEICDCRNSAHHKPLTIDAGCQYRLLDTVATPTILPKSSPPKLSLSPTHISPLQSSSSSSSAAPIAAAASTEAMARLANDHQKGVRKRSRRRKKLIGVGTISENTKRILLKHIPETASERRSTELKPDNISNPSQLLSTSHSLTSPTSSTISPGSLLTPVPSSHPSSSPSTTLAPSLPSTILAGSSELLPSKTSLNTDLSAVKLNLPVGLTLQQPGLLSLSRPVFVPLQPPELESDLIRGGCLIPVSSSEYPVSSSKTQDLSGTTMTVTPPSTLMKAAELEMLSSSDTVGELSEEDVHHSLEVDVVEQDVRGVASARGSLSRGRRGRPAGGGGIAFGKGRQAHSMRKKKTKGLGGSISETTRRMLLEHTSSDRSSHSKSTSRSNSVQQSEASGLAHSDSRESSTSMRSPPLGYSGSGTISESTKRILLEYYS